MNQRELRRIMRNFERRLLELRRDLDAVYTEAKLRKVRQQLKQL